MVRNMRCIDTQYNKYIIQNGFLYSKNVGITFGYSKKKKKKKKKKKYKRTILSKSQTTLPSKGDREFDFAAGSANASIPTANTFSFNLRSLYFDTTLSNITNCIR
jgi:hypothetical protein